MSLERDAQCWLGMRLGNELLLADDRDQHRSPRDVVAAALSRLAALRRKAMHEQGGGWPKKVAAAPSGPAALLQTHRHQF